jgi:hypothetical protein
MCKPHMYVATANTYGADERKPRSVQGTGDFTRVELFPKLVPGPSRLTLEQVTMTSLFSLHLVSGMAPTLPAQSSSGQEKGNPLRVQLPLLRGKCRPTAASGGPTFPSLPLQQPWACWPVKRDLWTEPQTCCSFNRQAHPAPWDRTWVRQGHLSA